MNPNLGKRSNNANNPTESTRDGHLLNCLNESREFENEISSDHDDNKSTFPNLAEGANNANNSRTDAPAPATEARGDPLAWRRKEFPDLREVEI